ncbi:hypothetical protein IMG5_173740 [Ichthyophthirius multifiliis]|uniref:Transmembrane protein n=1 Tax=Ichthyophthirius multifiliis TaxID=5932 RepID=G0R1Z3_ICHMU|nr:hypothetical protein IMG5_173740 [Ichthyophthirius multifiliis]EGR28518.1 hypothetical protein IMG5_173740 [Ichthyophthirius multifiliis]|eukprot:XP_004029754.1 hypothetical protein IMG5_173740 [Ichthyophthirius multifiliis]
MRNPHKQFYQNMLKMVHYLIQQQVKMAQQKMKRINILFKYYKQQILCIQIIQSIETLNWKIFWQISRMNYNYVILQMLYSLIMQMSPLLSLLRVQQGVELLKQLKKKKIKANKMMKLLIQKKRIFLAWEYFYLLWFFVNNLFQKRIQAIFFFQFGQKQKQILEFIRY